MNTGNVSDSTPAHGWQGSPSSRGTFDILSSCLVVILASTWTILHLNVPAATDTQTTKFFRKLKWMCFTIMFPEFMFAHAMEERLMANAVLQRLAEAKVNVKMMGPIKLALASTIGNLEWKGALDFLANGISLQAPITAKSKDTDDESQRPSRMATMINSKTTGQVSMTRSSEELPAPKRTSNNEIKSTSATSSIKIQSEHIQLDQIPSKQASPEPAPSDHTAPKHVSAKSAPPNHKSALPESSQKDYLEHARLEQVHKWTITHAIFANMGGFRLAFRPPNLQAKTLDDTVVHQTIDGFELANLLIAGTIPSVPDISKAAILDKSKTDAFARWLAILQLLWLLIELIVRQVEGLPSSQLEIATLAFACCSILTYLAVRDKPKDVAVSLDVPVDLSLPHKIRVDALFEGQRSFFLEVFLFRYWRPKNYKTVVFVTPFTYRFRSSHKERIKWQPEDITGKRITNDNYLVRNFLSHPMTGWMVIGSIIFGGIHCLAWNHYFPTRAERILWRASALVTTVAPLLLPIFDRGANSIRRFLEFLRIPPSTFSKLVLNGWNVVVPTFILVCYVSLRLCILVLVFASLREMPAGVYKTTWTKYLLSVS